VIHQEAAAVHALTRFIRDRMDQPPVMSQADLAKASGLSKQVISNLCADDREQLDRLPSERTINGLAAALAGGNVDVLLTVIGEAMGLPMNRVVTADATALSNDELLAEIARRLRGGRESAPGTVTPLPTVGGPGHDLVDDLEYRSEAARRARADYTKDRTRPAPPDEGA
jgi:transcriptional regulator with XRE-family HTH domain